MTCDIDKQNRGLIGAVLFQAVEDYIILWRARVVEGLKFKGWLQGVFSIAGITQKDALELLHALNSGYLSRILDLANIGACSRSLVNDLKNNPEKISLNLCGMKNNQRFKIIYNDKRKASK